MGSTGNAAILLVAVVGAGAGAVSEPETALGASLVGAATAVAVVVARVLQQVWPSKSDNAIRDLVVAVGRTNELLNSMSSSLQLMAKDVQEQRAEARRDIERIEVTLRDHVRSDDETLKGIDRAIGEIAGYMAKGV